MMYARIENNEQNDRPRSKAPRQIAVLLVAAIAVFSGSGCALDGDDQRGGDETLGEAKAASTSCTLWLCSETENRSSAYVFIARNWCWDSGTTASSTTSDPYCSDWTNDRKWIAPGESSPSGEDWDTFRVDAGWCYVVHFAEAEWYGVHEWDVTYNRVGQSTPVWVKVEDNALAIVKAQSPGSCP